MVSSFCFQILGSTFGSIDISTLNGDKMPGTLPAVIA
jgi:hypothetical protein